MLNPYAPPNDPTPLPRAEAIVDPRSMWFFFSLAVGGSSIAAVALVAKHYVALDVANPIAALAMAGLVMAIQVVSSAQIVKRSQTRSVLFTQCANVLSWSAVVGVLGTSHYILPSLPEMRAYDLVVFGGLALVSALLSFLTCYAVKRWN